MGRYSSDSDDDKRSNKASKIKSRRRSSSSDSADSRRTRRSTKKSYRRSRSKEHYSRSRRSRSSSYTSKSKSRRSTSRERSKYRQSSSRERYRRSKSRDRYRSRRSRSKSYIKEYTSKPKARSSSVSSSSEGSNSKDKSRKTDLKSKSSSSAAARSKGKTDKPPEDSGEVVVIDSKTLELINEDKFVSKPFLSKKTNKALDNIVIDLNKQTIKVPDVPDIEPDDSIFHHTLFISQEARMEKWIKDLCTYRQKALQQVFSVSLIIFMKTAWDLSEVNTCPWCFGLNYCAELQNNTTLQYDSFSKVVFNLFSVKNVYFARSGGTEVVIKKLIDKGDGFPDIRSEIKSEDLIDFLVEKKLRNFQVCSLETAQIFLNDFAYKNLSYLWTLLNINAEPLLLEIFPKEENWPVPRLLGYCGRTVIEENCGAPLNDIEDLSWHDRAYVALQLLEVSLKFTFEHSKFRLYLTDVSPDNIAVNMSNLKASVVDLENAILQRKIERIDTFHYTQHSGTDEYAFSKSEICSRTISDHNIYSICRLLLSSSAPYPMMSGGLLHSSPSIVDAARLFVQIELCVYSTNHVSRFLIVKQIKELIRAELHKVNYYNKH